jgi:hypothetical protein
MGFFIRIIRNGRIVFAIPAAAGTAVLPFLAATAYWALFSQYTAAGSVLFILALVPMSASMITAFIEKRA